jgi:hexokinase
MNNFLKRKKKEAKKSEPVKEMVPATAEKSVPGNLLNPIEPETEKEIVFVQERGPADNTPRELPNTAYDIFYSEEEKRHKVIIFKYDPKSGIAQVDAIKNIGRQIALQYDNQKTALKTLTRKT